MSETGTVYRVAAGGELTEIGWVRLRENGVGYTHSRNANPELSWDTFDDAVMALIDWVNSKARLLKAAQVEQGSGDGDA